MTKIGRPISVPIIPIAISIPVAILLLIGSCVLGYTYRANQEISDQEYDIIRDLYHVGEHSKNDPVYVNTAAHMYTRVSECMSDGKITNSEYIALLNERVDFIEKEKYRNARQELINDLNAYPKEQRMQLKQEIDQDFNKRTS